MSKPYDSVVQKIWELRNELVKQYGEDSPIVEIRLKRKTFHCLMRDLYNDQRLGWVRCFSRPYFFAEMAEPKVFDVTVLPEKR